MAKKGSASKARDRRRTKADAKVRALVVFVDIREFTAWSEKFEVASNLETFVAGFNSLLKKQFAGASLFKSLGDGAMIVEELGQKPVNSSSLLARTLVAVKAADVAFEKFCDDFGRSVGHGTALRLGWGIVWGDVRRLQVPGVPSDYVGSNVNKCARLCDIARPFGVALDLDDFPPKLPPGLPYQFSQQTRKLRGVDQVDVWVTPEIQMQFVPREKLREKPEVHVAGMCIERIGGDRFRLLIARRDPTREFYPSLYEGCGGQLAANETFAEGVVRHFRKEMDIEVRVLTELHCFYEIRLPTKPLVPGIRFLCTQVDTRKPQSPNHTEVRWVDEREFRDMKKELFVEDLKNEVLLLLDRYKGGA